MRDLAWDKLHASARAFVVEKDATGRVKSVALAVIDRDPVTINLRHTIRGAGVKWGVLVLWRLAHFAKHLRRAGLIETDAWIYSAYRVQQARDPQGGYLAGEA